MHKFCACFYNMCWSKISSPLPGSVECSVEGDEGEDDEDVEQAEDAHRVRHLQEWIKSR